VYVRVTSFIDWILLNTEDQLDADYVIVADAATCRDSPNGADEDTDIAVSDTDPLGGPTCGGGFISNGNVCLDIDECDETDACPENSSCTNNDGGYDCDCNTGYAATIDPDDGPICADIDECGLMGVGEFECVANTCVNSEGSYNCVCPAGFQGDALNSGTGCTEIPETITCLPGDCGYTRVVKMRI
jgi:hypothetical protein